MRSGSADGASGSAGGKNSAPPSAGLLKKQTESAYNSFRNRKRTRRDQSRLRGIYVRRCHLPSGKVYQSILNRNSSIFGSTVRFPIFSSTNFKTPPSSNGRFSNRSRFHHSGKCRQAPGSFFCVGDTKQSIYQWRGGCPKFLMPSKRNIVTRKSVEKECLAENWRDSPVIIETVNQVFERITDSMPDRHGKTRQHGRKHQRRGQKRRR